MSSSDLKKTVVLKSSDGEEFEVEEAVAMQSDMVKVMIEDLGAAVYPLNNVTGKILAKVIEYCKRQANHSGDEEAREKELAAFDAEFIKKEEADLVELFVVANYLNIPGLLDIIAQAIADRIKDMQPEEVRRHYKIVNDFTPEEEAKVRAENPWAYSE